MRDTSIRAGDMKTGRLLQLLAGLALVFLIVLGTAPVRPYFAEWRTVQQEYNRSAVEVGAPPTSIGVKQIWRPALDVTDRCTTCHLGMAGTATPITGHSLFGTHPRIPHDPREFGCTVCHGGQGRATTRAAAHGFVSHWDEQLLDRRHMAAGCATCHDQFASVSTATLSAGQRLVEQLDCLSCHRLDGRGRGDAPELTYVGVRGFEPAWYRMHLANSNARTSPAWQSSFGPISPADRNLLEKYLNTRVGAPLIAEARALAMERGCLGCHKLGGIGGDEGPPLETVGRKPAGDLNFAYVQGPKTFTNYMREHLLDPVRVFPGSTMIAQDYSGEELDLLTTWVLSLRARDVPARFLPKERLRRQLLAEPAAPRSAEENFGMFCAACHGPRGQGRSVGTPETRFPAIGSGDFLNVASDDFVLQTLTTGRPNRRMPAWAAAGGTLDQSAAEGLVRLLRARLGEAPTRSSLAALPANPGLGATTYRDDCAGCHGESGGGTALGPPLASPDRPLSPARAYDATLRGVAGTAMPAYSDRRPAALAGVLRFLETLPRSSASRAAWRPGSGDATRGADVYDRSCSGCHGPKGEGRLGPALASPAFLQAATPEYVEATIVRGRAGTPMPAFGRDNAGYQRLAADEVLDLTAFIRERLGRDPRARGDN